VERITIISVKKISNLGTLPVTSNGFHHSHCHEHLKSCIIILFVYCCENLKFNIPLCTARLKKGNTLKELQNRALGRIFGSTEEVGSEYYIMKSLIDTLQ
jgi:hypothetical protein